ncbi:hypothetical protein QVD17_34763 [Tagetes erecta]|uniref:Uncharacterized protein n=1 Tax=Tagetes erecta TaxID=13708 RepID=A0AAD8K083_TARER|nr:hypothetical protein QVD17_34763 [Tagetes erecta]
MCDDEKECIEYEETSSKDTLSPKNKVVKDTKTSDKKKKIEAIRDLQAEDGSIKVQEYVAQFKDETAQRKNEDIGKLVRNQNEAHVTRREDKDDNIYKQGKKLKFKDKGLLHNAYE